MEYKYKYNNITNRKYRHIKIPIWNININIITLQTENIDILKYRYKI